MWNSLDNSIRNSYTVPKFKSMISPSNYRIPVHFSYGERKLNIIHTRLRNGCSALNADLFRVNLVQSPACRCSYPVENAIHYFFDCTLYTDHRTVFFNNLTKFQIILDTNVLLNGSNLLTFDENQDLFKCVQDFIKISNRF